MANPKQPYGWNGNEGEFISANEAKAGVEAYKASSSYAANGKCSSHYIGGKKLMRLLSEGKAVGVRAYYMKSQGITSGYNFGSIREKWVSETRLD